MTEHTLRTPSTDFTPILSPQQLRGFTEQLLTNAIAGADTPSLVGERNGTMHSFNYLYKTLFPTYTPLNEIPGLWDKIGQELASLHRYVDNTWDGEHLYYRSALRMLARFLAQEVAAHELSRPTYAPSGHIPPVAWFTDLADSWR